MGWKDVRVGSGQYITLKDDGDTVELVFLGEPHEQSWKGANGKAKRRYIFNVAKGDTEGKALVFPAGPTLADQIATALDGGELAGKVALVIKREGEAGDRDTTYDVSKPRKLKPAEFKKLAALELIDLEAEPLPTGGKF